MSGAMVGRIFWKELRTLKGLWLTLAGFAVVLQFSIALWLTYDRPWWIPERMLTGAAGTFLVGYIASALYAIATAAASFTSEQQGATKTFFQMVPVRRAEAFAGKWSYGLASTMALLAALGAVACIACIAVGTGFHLVFPWSPDPQGLAVAAEPANEFLEVRIGILLPIEIFALCSLFSLLFADVLLAAACGTFASVIALCGWWMAPSWFNLLFIATVISVDFWLTGKWLLRGPLIATESSGFSDNWPNPLNLIRAWQPAIPWKRSAQCLIWKELRQALPVTALGLLAAVATAFHTAFYPRVNNPNPSTMFFSWTAHWIAFLSIPLLMGLAGQSVEQKGRTFRLFCEHGVSPLGTWIIKHVVWLSLTFLVCIFLLACDQRAAAWAFDGFGRWPPHWAAPDTLVNALAKAMAPNTFAGTRLPVLPAPASSAVSAMALHVLVAYSIGQFFSFLTPKAVVALGAGIGGTAFVCLCWAVLHGFGVPSSWTIGAVPAVLLFFTLCRAEFWQTDRSQWTGLGAIAAWAFLPTAAVAGCIILLRIHEIPWTSNHVQFLQRNGRPALMSSGSETGKLWLRAAAACERIAEPDKRTALRDWSTASPAQRKWVANCGDAIALALDAAKHGPSTIDDPPPAAETQSEANKWARLARLLAFSARERESADQLDDSFLRYQASLHLSTCLSNRYQTWFTGRQITLQTLEHMRAWAAHPKQTTTRVNGALMRIWNLNNEVQPLSNALHRQWTHWVTSGDKLDIPFPARVDFQARRSESPQALARPFFPWEANRDRRIANALFATTFFGVAEAERALFQRGWISSSSPAIENWDDQCIRLLRWLSTTPSMSRGELVVSQDALLALVNSEAQRRMNVIAIALASFRREHGHFPASLEELAPRNVLNLTDPWSGSAFCYTHHQRPPRQGRAVVSKRESSETTYLLSEGYSQVRPSGTHFGMFETHHAGPLMTHGAESGGAVTGTLKE